MSTIDGPFNQPKVEVPAFDQATHDSVMNFLGTFNTINLKKMTTHSTTVRTICTIAATAFACVAAVAYKTAHKGAAIGLGIGAVVILVVGIVKGVRVAKEFLDFSESCSQAAKHLRNAYLSKALFMISKNQEDSTQWNAKTDLNLCNIYNLNFRASDPALTSLTKEQHKWHQAHDKLYNALYEIDSPKLDTVKDPAVKNLLTNFIKATEIFRYGQTPGPPGRDYYPYVNYSDKGPATFWESAGVSTTSANA